MECFSWLGGGGGGGGILNMDGGWRDGEMEKGMV